MLLVAMVNLAALIATASTGPEKQISLVCTGSQVTYRDDVATKASLPWSRTYKIALKARTYCETRCRPDASVDTADGTQLVFNNLEYGPKSTRLTYKSADGSIYGHQVVSFSDTVGFHLETRGTCQIAPDGS